MKSRIVKLFLTIGLAGAVCLTCTPAEALFVSVKTLGRVNTQCAYPEDSLVPAINPAGATEIGNRLDIEAGWVREGARAKTTGNRGFTAALGPQGPFVPVTGINGNRYATRTRDYFPAGFGINQQFCLCDQEFYVGFCVYNRNQIKTRYKDHNPLIGRTPPGLEYIHETAALNFAYKFWCQHSLGLSINYNIQRFKVDGIQNFDHPPFTVFIPGVIPPTPVPGTSRPGHVTNRGYNYSSGVGYTIGYFWNPNDCFKFGIAYTPRTHMKRLTKYSGLLPAHGSFDIPSRITAGISWRWLQCSTIAFDVEHIRWREIATFRNGLLNSFGGVDPLGSKSGPGFGWRNQTFFRLGIDYNWTECLTLRAGFRHATQVTRRSQTALNILTIDVVQDVLTFGATYALNQCNEVSFVYAHGFNRRVRGDHALPPAFGGGNVHIERHLDAIGFSWAKVW